MDTTRSHYDCLIAGAGPAGIFAALELVRRNGSSVLLLEQGPDIDRRVCPARTTGVCSSCSPCDVTCGWGGAGAFSDGKLTLSPEVGGWLGEFVPADALTDLVHYVDDVWLEYGAPHEVHGTMSPSVEAIRRQALVHGMTLVTSPVRHMGSDRAADILRAMRADLGRERELAVGEGAGAAPAAGDVARRAVGADAGGARRAGAPVDVGTLLEQQDRAAVAAYELERGEDAGGAGAGDEAVVV